MLTLLPLIWELIDDRHGESIKDKQMDIYRRIALAIIGAALDAWILNVNFFAAVLFSFAEFFLIFDYAIAYILHHKDVFSYIGKTGKWANFHVWNWIGPWGRFAIRLVIFVAALIWYA